MENKVIDNVHNKQKKYTDYNYCTVHLGLLNIKIAIYNAEILLSIMNAEDDGDINKKGGFKFDITRITT